MKSKRYEKEKESNKLWKELHKEEVKEYTKKYNELHREELKEYSKKYRESHKDESSIYQKEYRLKNLTKITEQKKLYYSNNRDRLKLVLKNNHLKRSYGITLTDKLFMLERQNSRCLICLIFMEFKDSCVDHNHVTGKVRGLLCNSCNQGIGFLKADNGSKLFLKTIDYLKIYDN